MKITLLCDTLSSWILPYAHTLQGELQKRGHTVALVHSAEEIQEGDVAFFLGCEKLVPKRIRDRNAHNLVVHESALPEGKGWSPLTWQILEGKNEIPITLFEADEKIDNGAIYLQDVMRFQGHELIDEMRQVQGEKTIELSLRYFDENPSPVKQSRSQKESFYARRVPKDSELDTKKTLSESFDTLRVVDNQRYPAFFNHRDHTYVLNIFKKSADTDITLQPGVLDDARDLFAWRNDPEARRYFVHTAPVTWEEHMSWLTKVLHDERARHILCIAKVGGRSVGVVRGEEQSDGTIEISYTIAPDARGKGWGKRMTATFVGQYCVGKPILAKILKGHEPSEKVAKHLGLRASGEEVHDGRAFVMWRS